MYVHKSLETFPSTVTLFHISHILPQEHQKYPPAFTFMPFAFIGKVYIFVLLSLFGIGATTIWVSFLIKKYLLENLDSNNLISSIVLSNGAVGSDSFSERGKASLLP